MVELDDQLPNLAQEVNKGFVSLKALINRSLEQGKFSGELRKDADTTAVTEMIFSGILGATISYGMEKSPANADRTINALLDYLSRWRPSRQGLAA
jgi:Tetracyclin repressor-like, C-terminal domain